MVALAAFWILLLITASGIQDNTWYLLGVGGIGVLQNIAVAGWRRTSAALGVHLDFDHVIEETKVINTLLAVQEMYPKLGRSMLATFFPGDLRPAERSRWVELERRVNGS